MAAMLTSISLYGQSLPNVEDSHQLAVTANSLRGYLQREFDRLRGGNRFAPELKQVYDAVYLPITSSLAGRLQTFDITDSEILHAPLSADPELAATQLCRLLKSLYRVVVAVSENCAPAI